MTGMMRVMGVALSLVAGVVGASPAVMAQEFREGGEIARSVPGFIPQPGQVRSYERRQQQIEEEQGQREKQLLDQQGQRERTLLRTQTTSEERQERQQRQAENRQGRQQQQLGSQQDRKVQQLLRQ